MNTEKMSRIQGDILDGLRAVGGNPEYDLVRTDVFLTALLGVSAGITGMRSRNEFPNFGVSAPGVIPLSEILGAEGTTTDIPDAGKIVYPATCSFCTQAKYETAVVWFGMPIPDSFLRAALLLFAGSEVTPYAAQYMIWALKENPAQKMLGEYPKISGLTVVAIGDQASQQRGGKCLAFQDVISPEGQSTRKIFLAEPDRNGVWPNDTAFLVKLQKPLA